MHEILKLRMYTNHAKKLEANVKPIDQIKQLF